MPHTRDLSSLKMIVLETPTLTPMSSRGRKESYTQVIHKRSNSLSFDHKLWTTSPSPPLSSVYAAEPDSYSPTTTAATAISRPPTLTKINSHGAPLHRSLGSGQQRGYTFDTPTARPTPKRQPVMRTMLLPPDNSAMFNQFQNRGRKLSHEREKDKKRRQSTGSIRPLCDDKMPREQSVFLTDLPTEVLNLIMNNLEQRDVRELMLAGKALVEIAADYMYYHPKFASTYRFAQFVYIVSHAKHYALRVRHLDVSYFTEVPQLQRTPMAGWREWKYRSHDLYRPPHKFSVPPKKVRRSPPVTPKRGHPVPNPFLQSWALSRDIPLGGLCHCLIACLNLRVVNLSRCQLAEDHLVQDSDYPPNAWTGVIYVSDVPKSWTWRSEELRPVYTMYVFEQLVRLQHLETIIATNWVGLNTHMVRELVMRGQPSLEKVDFVGSGLEKEKAWAIRGGRERVREIVEEMDGRDPKRVVVSPKSLP